MEATQAKNKANEKRRLSERGLTRMKARRKSLVRKHKHTDAAFQKLRDAFELEDASMSSSEDEASTDAVQDKRNTKVETEARSWLVIRNSTRGHSLINTFVRHVRGLMASGASAKSVRKQLLLNARYFMTSIEEYDHFKAQVPNVRWFQYQREGLGAEAYLYTWI